MKGSRDCFSGQDWSPDHSWKSCGSMWRHQTQGLMKCGVRRRSELCAHRWDTDYVNSYKNEYVCVCACKFHGLPVKWKPGLGAVLVFSLHFRPAYIPTNRQGIVESTVYSPAFALSSETAEKKFNFSLRLSVLKFDLPDNTFGSRTWNFLFACSCYIKSVVGAIIFIENLRIPALGDDSDRCFQTVN